MNSEFVYWYIRRPLSKAPYKVARMMPRWLVYYCAMRLISHATSGEYENTIVPELTAMDALKRWEQTK
ncbi:MAG TPA: hypothetical protein VFH85_07890 [Gammaproteobacteria bacterium]|nr:hypothetical protein [Gammaproteobacteria bacterium]